MRGGAIQWFDPLITDNSNTFTKNYAPYSSDLGSYPKRLYLEFISNNDDLNQTNYYRKNQTLLEKDG